MYTAGCVASLLAADATTVFMCGEEDDCDCHGTLLFGRRSDGSAIPYVSTRRSTPVSTQRTALFCLLRRPERERAQGVGCACLPTDERLRAKLRSETVGRLAVQATYLLGGSELTPRAG